MFGDKPSCNLVNAWLDEFEKHEKGREEGGGDEYVRIDAVQKKRKEEYSD